MARSLVTCGSCGISTSEKSWHFGVAFYCPQYKECMYNGHALLITPVHASTRHTRLVGTIPHTGCATTLKMCKHTCTIKFNINQPLVLQKQYRWNFTRAFKNYLKLSNVAFIILFILYTLYTLLCIFSNPNYKCTWAWSSQGRYTNVNYNPVDYSLIENQMRSLCRALELLTLDGIIMAPCIEYLLSPHPWSLYCQSK